ncbi:glycoside hydrolase family 32 protein [Gilliamella sp. Pas-s95]|uniref:glycoside hydrolase family 32 protein n=1 Tax=Gilliamella sp. Pas-s95 TaxID=2687317 RepID=UPI00132067FA|nr:glycoside hydrolase family 32 protein [Gilliamella sp. Pas-s95]MWN06659.1 sucrose-6-phosphate hydrolase [Gilliamella sp. Pas-s95]
MSSAIDKANQAVKKLAQFVNKQYYPHFHLAPQSGWMNDPNGLIYFKGQYHAFYQHHPYDENWGPMHWGHAVSDDLVTWRRLPIAIAPDQEFDKSGCFSGSAVDNDGELCLFYTGHVWLSGQGDDEQISQTQCLASSQDGIHFEKHGTVLAPKDGIMHFRDPKVWQQDGQWWMVVGQRTPDNVGEVLLYRSGDLTNWTFDHVVVSHIDPNVYMLECPDFFSLGDKWVLMFSPQGMQAKGYQYRNLFQSGYIVGHWQPSEQFSIIKPFQEMDFGHDFYAPQSFLAADGRRIVFAWMDMWESTMPSKKDKWAGAFTLPRELILDKDNYVRNCPIKELEALREKPESLNNILLKNELKNTDIQSISCEINIEFDLIQSDAERFGLQLAATEDGKQATLLYVDLQSERIILDRSLSGLELTGYRSVPLPKTDKLTLHIFVDASSVEVFVNDDLYSLTSRIYPQLPAKRVINLFAENGKAKVTKLESWQLQSIYA